jgi:hypothetical protein
MILSFNYIIQNFKKLIIIINLFLIIILIKKGRELLIKGFNLFGH